MKTDSFTFGRVTGDYLIKESDIGEDYIKSISSVQCEILKNKDGVFLKDYSTNGELFSTDVKIFRWRYW